MPKIRIANESTLCECGSNDVTVYFPEDTAYKINPETGELTRYPLLDGDADPVFLCTECDAKLEFEIEYDAEYQLPAKSMSKLNLDQTVDLLNALFKSDGITHTYNCRTKVFQVYDVQDDLIATLQPCFTNPRHRAAYCPGVLLKGGA